MDERMSFNPENNESVWRLHESIFQPNNDDEFLDSESDVSEDLVEERLQSSDTEQDGEEFDDEEEFFDHNSVTIYGKDRTTAWTTQPPPRNRRTLKRNIVSCLPGTKGTAKNAITPIDCWQLMFDTDMLKQIAEGTNYQISLVKENYSRARDAMDTDETEIKAFLGVLYLLGAKKLNRTSLQEIWTQDMTGEEFCRSTISIKRFKFLIKNLRFDNKASREQRKKIDKLAPVRQIFEALLKNAQNHYCVSQYTTIDEKLEAFRGRCSFRQYIPSKPAKYGVKIFALADSRTFYTLNMEICAGKQPPGPYDLSTTPHNVVMRLSTPIRGTNRNITMDNWFTSVPLSEELLRYKLTMVGTCRKNEKELPATIVNTKNRIIPSSEFFFDQNRTLVSYHPKKNKVAILLSTMHHDADIDERTGKPDVVTFYNLTKSGVDTVDQLCSTYNVARNTRRWPMVVFYSMLNVAGINALIINASNTQEVIRRRLFLKKLAHELVACHVKRRVYTKTLPLELSIKVRKLYNIIFPDDENQKGPEDRSSKRRCYMCPSKIDRKSALRCGKCGNNICLKTHAKYICKPLCQNELQSNIDSDCDSP